MVCSAAFFRDFSFCPRDGTPLVEAGENHLIQTTVDRFPLRALLAEGRLGRVYRAELGEKKYAVKVLVGDLSADTALVKKFRQSAHLLSKVRHTNVMEVIEFDTTEGGLAFVASNFVPGRTLESIVKAEGPLPRARAEKILRDIAAGLAAAHDVGLVYRDLRPSNVVVSKNGRATICDFRLVGLRPPTSEYADTSIPYAAPECLDAHIGPASDLYSLGVILADMLEGGPDANHPLLTLLLHRLPEGRLRSARDVLAELGDKRARRRPVETGDLALTSDPDPEPVVEREPVVEGAPVAEPEPAVERAPAVASAPIEANVTPDAGASDWASHIAEPPPIEEVAPEDVLEVVVGDPDRSVQWPKTQAALADLLVSLSILTTTEKKRVAAEVQANHKRFMQVLAEMLPELADRAVKALATHLDLEVWASGSSTIHPRVLATIPKALATELGVVPYALRSEQQGNTLFVAISDPSEKPARTAIEAMVNHPVVWAIASADAIDDALEAAYGKEVRKGVPATMRIRRPGR